jgi:hypothetical protein
LGERGGLVEHLLRNADLAQIVQQAGLAIVARFLRIETEERGDIDHQGADRDGMGEGVFVLGLEAHDIDHGARAVGDGIGDILDQFVRIGHAHGPTHAGIVEQATHSLARLPTMRCTWRRRWRVMVCIRVCDRSGGGKGTRRQRTVPQRNSTALAQQRRGRWILELAARASSMIT